MLDLPGIRQDVPLAALTTYQIGGPAELFVTVGTQAELARAVTTARRHEVPFFILGCGANILIRDGGLKGLVIYNRANAVRFKGATVYAESGAIMADVIAACAACELSGLEHFAGIPSTIGGALRQNLHFLAPDRQSTLFIERAVIWASVLNEHDQVILLERRQLQFGYDDSVFHHRPLIALAATFELEPAPRDGIERQIADNLAWREAHQPQLVDFASCGSVFKKIAGVGAGRLIDQCGLKGFTIGRAQVSSQHANYIVNLGGASSADVEAVIAHVQQVVTEKTGYTLEPEIGIIGEK